MGWTSTKQDKRVLLKDPTQGRGWGSNPRPLGLESSTLPLSHCAKIIVCVLFNVTMLDQTQYSLISLFSNDIFSRLVSTSSFNVKL